MCVFLSLCSYRTSLSLFFSSPARMIHWKYPSKDFEKFSFMRNFLNVSLLSTRVLSLLNSLEIEKGGAIANGFFLLRLYTITCAGMGKKVIYFSKSESGGRTFYGKVLLLLLSTLIFLLYSSAFELCGKKRILYTKV